MNTIRKELLLISLDLIDVIKELLNNIRKYWIEWLLVILLAISFFIWIMTYAINLSRWSDPMFYIRTAFNRDTIHVRSVHIYLLTLFLYFSNNLIAGGNIFLAFIVTLMIIITYITARYLSNSILVLAVRSTFDEKQIMR
jgi:hypothetical protein